VHQIHICLRLDIEDNSMGIGRLQLRYPPVVWKIPFGFAVVPEVYKMKSGCSAIKALRLCVHS